jgi:hypothetical protein
MASIFPEVLFDNWTWVWYSPSILRKVLYQTNACTILGQAKIDHKSPPPCKQTGGAVRIFDVPLTPSDLAWGLKKEPLRVTLSFLELVNSPGESGSARELSC